MGKIGNSHELAHSKAIKIIIKFDFNNIIIFNGLPIVVDRYDIDVICMWSQSRHIL